MLGAERLTGVGGAHDQLGETQQAKPLLIYNKVSLLTVKNPNNKLDKEELLRVCYSLKNIIGFSTIYYTWFERGHQGQNHIHMIIKKTYPKNEADISKMSKSFKQRKLKYYKYMSIAEYMNPWGLGDLVEYTIDTNQCNFLLSKIENQQHLNELIFEYRFKELDPDFID